MEPTLPTCTRVLKTCPQCGGSYEPGTQFCPRDGTALSLPTGLIAGKYQLLGELGSGGMGVVYLANQVSMDRRCALKVLSPATVSAPDTLARFHREAQSASRISHPNVVGVFDFGTTDDGMAYLAMEYVEGQSLEQLLAGGAIGPRRTARIIWQIANGLSVAHDLRIVHRDLKPGNIMLTRYRSWDDFVKVVDFGIAKPVGATSTSAVTSTGLRIGTPAYMSPEQWIDGNVDHRSDIYSLAVIAVEMLSGKRPTTIPGLAVDTRPGQTLPAAWPPDVKSVLARALAPLPDERYDSVSAFSAAFVGAVNAWEPPTPDVREPWDERLGTPVSSPAARPRAVLTGAIGLVAVALAAWLGWRTIDRDVPVAPAPDAAPAESGSGPFDTTTLPPVPTPRQATTSPPAIPERAAPGLDSLALVRTAFDLDRPDADSARRVAGIAAALLRGPLDDSARVEVSYRLAEARFFLGDAFEACAALDSVRGISERIGYLARSITVLRDRHC